MVPAGPKASSSGWAKTATILFRFFEGVIDSDNYFFFGKSRQTLINRWCIVCKNRQSQCIFKIGGVKFVGDDPSVKTLADCDKIPFGDRFNRLLSILNFRFWGL